MSEYEEVLSFWFGELDERGRADSAHAARWWKKDPAFDGEIRDRFETLHRAVANGEREEWLSSARGRLAYVIVLDQFSRNMFRDSGKMFACDPQALAAALGGIELGMDRQVAHDERSFFYMPLMHSEDLAAQDRCVALFAAWRDELAQVAPEEKRADSVSYAERHRDIVKRFSRFPHRNALLGRESTPEELEFLTKPGSSF
jgi:uncharacterized protein (DUF924 family)